MIAGDSHDGHSPDSAIDGPLKYIHPESERYVVKTLAHIKEMGAQAGIAVNPDTSVSSISEILNLCDYVMVMTVNPGFAGQGFIDFTRKKVCQLAELKEQQRQEQMGEIKGELKKIEWGSQIRSYVFQPYTMVKDHRTGYEMGDVNAVMDGKLEGFVTSYLQKL